MRNKAFIYIIICALLAIFSCQRNTSNETKSTSSEDLLKSARKYYDSNQFSKAKEQYDLILKTDTTIGEAYFSRAYCFAIEGNIEKSNSDYEKCIDLKYREESSYFNLGCNYAIQLQDSVALIYFKKAYSINPLNEKAKNEITLLEGK